MHDKECDSPMLMHQQVLKQKLSSFSIPEQNEV
jgi:hypothetical protein